MVNKFGIVTLLEHVLMYAKKYRVKGEGGMKTNLREKDTVEIHKPNVY